MGGAFRWLSKPFITPLDMLIVLGAARLGDHLGWWSILVAIPLLIGSTAIERRYWTMERRP